MSRLVAPHLLSTINGAIKHVLFSIPSWIFDRDLYPYAERSFIDGYIKIVEGMMRTATKQTIYTMLTHNSTRDLLRHWLLQKGLSAKTSVVVSPDDLRFTVWCNDMFMMCADEGGWPPRCIIPPEFPRSGDSFVAELLTRLGCISINRSPLFFQGGNILVGDDFLLIGVDDLQNSFRKGRITTQKGETKNAAVKRALRFGLDCGRNAYVIQTRRHVCQQTSRAVVIDGRQWNETLYFGNVTGTRQPLFHIDMFISMMGRSPGGSFKLLVGDPKMAASMVQSTGWPDPMLDAFDDIALKLSKYGFQVERNPLPLAFFDDPENRVRVWYFATSNNVIVQDDPPIVWMPTYGHGRWSELAKTDAVNQAIWERSGYEVRILPDCNPIAAKHGGVHCITKCLVRATPLI
jgi:hypothetical protein